VTPAEQTRPLPETAYDEIAAVLVAAAERMRDEERKKAAAP
jgi:hypothetical protein